MPKLITTLNSKLSILNKKNSQFSTEKLTH